MQPVPLKQAFLADCQTRLSKHQTVLTSAASRGMDERTFSLLPKKLPVRKLYSCTSCLGLGGVPFAPAGKVGAKLQTRPCI